MTDAPNGVGPGVLRRFRDWGPVSNHRLLGGGFISAHVVYERSRVFSRP